MDSEYEMSSSSLSFASMAGGGGPNAEVVDAATPDYMSLSKLSSCLEKLLLDPGFVYTADAEIVVDGVPVGVHRCLLAARSDYFHGLFSKPCDAAQEDARESDGSNQKPRYRMPDSMGHVGLEAFNVFLNYLYTGRLKQSPPEVSTCVVGDGRCIHDSCRPAIDYAVELMYASTTFQIKELVLLLQRHLLSFVDKALTEDVIPILVASFRCNSEQLLSCCIKRVSDSDLDNISLEKELPPEVLPEINRLRKGPGLILPQSELSDHQKRIRRILKALDSDDVELIKLLLGEGEVTLDDAHALHYAAAYSDPMVFKKVLDMKLADLNLKNSRGLTALHVAARRKVPSILVALLNNGADALETTPDGQTALEICRRLTRPKDYNVDIQKGKESNKDKVCIDLLERELKNAPVFGIRSVWSEVTADDIHLLEYLESRVKMAKMLFPAEAKIAMETAGADWTPLYKGLANDTTSMSAERLQQKLRALRETVEIGQRYFPNCSEEIVKFIDDMPDALILEKGSEQEQKLKKMRFMELRDDVQRAFHKDMAVKNASTHCPSPPSPSVSSSSSSASPRNRIRSKMRVRA